MNRLAIASIAVSAAVAAAGCGSSDDTEQAAAPAAASAAAAEAGPPQALLGSYTRMVTKADIERTQKKRSELGPNQQKPKPARTSITFEPTAVTTRDPSADFVVQQDYSATSAGRLTLRGYQHPEVGAFCGPEIPQTATYTWKVAGDSLTLEENEDPCADRDSTFTGVWTRR